MLNGFYSLYYTGTVASGFAVIVLEDGVVTGADVTGGLFDGEYTINQEKSVFEGTIRMTVPAGISLVTGAPPSQTAYTQDIPLSLPLDLNQGRPMLVHTSTGPVNLNMKKLRDL